jgi:DnaJ family protein C protein 19
MATPVIIGVGAITAALVGRQLFRAGVIGGKKAAEQWVKGGFRAKMDRKEAVAILGLKCAQHNSCVACCKKLIHSLCG